MLVCGSGVKGRGEEGRGEASQEKRERRGKREERGTTEFLSTNYSLNLFPLSEPLSIPDNRVLNYSLNLFRYLIGSQFKIIEFSIMG